MLSRLCVHKDAGVRIDALDLVASVRKCSPILETELRQALDDALLLLLTDDYTK